jgi:hypothetical protein
LSKGKGGGWDMHRRHYVFSGYIMKLHTISRRLWHLDGRRRRRLSCHYYGMDKGGGVRFHCKRALGKA